jgi:nuclear transport factor 2 (NTF2) superfamily protein
LENGLAHHRDVVPNFAGSQRAKKIVRLAEASLANRQLKKPGMAFSTDC